MPKVNGNDGNNNESMKAVQAYYESLRAKASGNTNKSSEVKNNVPIGQSKKVENSDKLLLESANFYAGMGLNLNTKKTQLGSLDDLAQVAPNLTASQADRSDKKAAYNAIKGNDWSSYLTRAYVYSRINDTSIKTLASVDFSEDRMPEYIADDINAEVVIA